MDPEKENQERLSNHIVALRSGNRTAILATLRELRAEGHYSILPELFDILLDQEDQQILTETRRLLNDIKDQQAAAILAGAINNEEYRGISTDLAAACWQNGLSYGEYLDQFVEAAISGDYSTAIEAFTVIEDSIGEVEKNQRERFMETIRSRLPEVDAQKKSLLLELIKVIDNY
jgi:hypothetical protein